MILLKTSARRAALLVASASAMTAQTAGAVDLTMWVRDSGATLTTRVVERWNEMHPQDPIELTVIPANDLLTKFATASAAGDVPDLLSLDLIFAPPLMRSGQLMDITDQMADDPNIGKAVQAHIDLATYEGRLYGVPFTPDNSVLIWNKDLFEQAGLDPEDPPSTTEEIVAAARAIGALGDDIHGWHFSGACAGCNIFTMAPQMWASEGTAVLPDSCEAEPLQGESIRQILQGYRTMWEEGLIAESAQVDTGANFMTNFLAGNVGLQGTGNFAIGLAKEQAPDLNFGIAFLPGPNESEVSSFAGGDILTIPADSPNPEKALEMLKWVLTDDPQLEVYAKTGNLPARTDLADNEYFQEDPRLTKTAEALAVAQTPYTYWFFQLSNDPAGPWLEMIQTAVFDGDIDGAIEYAKQRMNDIACEQ